MSTTYTPTATELATLTLPADGDLRAAASVNGPLQALADDSAYRKARNKEFYAIATDASATLGSSSAATYGTGDYMIQGGTSTAETGVTALVSFTCQGGATDACVGEYRLAYQIDAGALTPIPGSTVKQTFDGAGDSQALTLQGAVTFGATTGDLKVYLQMRKLAGSGSVVAGSPCGGFVWLRKVDS